MLSVFNSPDLDQAANLYWKPERMPEMFIRNINDKGF